MGTSHQRGWVRLRGKKWYGYYRRTVLDPIKNAQKVDRVQVIRPEISADEISG
jgi:hypothetical protein